MPESYRHSFADAQPMHKPMFHRNHFVCMQVRECATALLHVAKRERIPIFLVGHVTKTGDIAGPRVLEHIVDTVLYMEGERHQNFRLLRGIKNRYGATDEAGAALPATESCHQHTSLQPLTDGL